MSDRERYKREDPGRPGPIRDWRARSRGGEPPRREPGAGAPTGPGDEGGGPWGDVVTEAVDLGYRVIEEQIRLGQRVAEGMSQRRYGPAAMTNDFRETAERMLDLGSRTGQLWFEFLTSFWANGDPTRAFFRGPAQGTGRAPHSADAGPAITVEVSSVRPVRVTVDLRPGCEGLSLAAPELRALDRQLPPLLGASFEPARRGQPLLLRVDVPETQPGGAYHGVVVDKESGRQCGTLGVELGGAR